MELFLLEKFVLKGKIYLTVRDTMVRKDSNCGPGCDLGFSPNLNVPQFPYLFSRDNNGPHRMFEDSMIKICKAQDNIARPVVSAGYVSAIFLS
jgi:hypothetical protein